MKLRTIVTYLMILVLLAGSFSTPRPVQAGLRINPFHIVRALLAETPLGKAAKPFIDRREAYREADRWLQQKQQEAALRNAQLEKMLKNDEIDVHTFIKYRANNLALQKQYEEARSAMKAVAKETFGKQFLQVFVDQVMPVVLRSEGFKDMVKGLNDALANGQKIMKDGLKDIAALKEKIIPEPVNRFEEKLKELKDKLDKSGLSGGPIDEVKARLSQVQAEIARIRAEAKELATPDLVKQLEQEAQQSINELGRIQQTLQEEVAKIEKNQTVRIPVKSAAKDPRVQAAVKKISQGEARAVQVSEEMKIRRATRESVDTCLAAAGIDRANPNYWRIRGRIEEELLKIGKTDMPQEQINGICMDLARKVETEATKITYSLAEMSSTGSHTFTVNVAGEACPQTRNGGGADTLGASISINLVTGEVSGLVSASAVSGVYESPHKGDYVLCKSTAALAGPAVYDSGSGAWSVSGTGTLQMDCHYIVLCGSDAESGLPMYAGGDIRLDLPFSYSGSGNGNAGSVGFKACNDTACFEGSTGQIEWILK